MIKFYQFILSPVFGGRCRFYPSCSEYAIESFRRKGFFRGVFYTIRRLLRCHPFSRGGYDPVDPADKAFLTEDR